MVDKETVEHIAKLARIRIDERDMSEVTDRLREIMAMIDRMQSVNVDDIEPMANPHDAYQRLRTDTVTESDQRASLQAIAPQVEDGLYIVPQVIE